MSRHLKNIVMSGLKNIISSYVPSPAVSTPPARGVHYFQPITSVEFLWGAMDKLKLGRKRRKHIIVRRYPHLGNRLLQLYTYHFPTHWSEACVANCEPPACNPHGYLAPVLNRLCLLRRVTTQKSPRMTSPSNP